MSGTTRPPAAIALIGCGHQAERAHLPILADPSHGVTLAVVVETAAGATAARARLDRFGLGGVPLAVLPERTGGSPETLHDLLRTATASCCGAIVSTPSIARTPYLRWLLDRELPVLAEKPPLIHPGASTDIAAAKRTLDDYDELLAHPASARMSIATQRRYNPIYHRIAEHCRAIGSAEGQPITFVQASTNDGLWSDDHRRYPIYDPAATGGGKLINTGYHLLDIVPWIMRHASPDPAIAYADISTDATRAAAGNEIDVALQIAFKDRSGRTACHFQLAALHGGLSRRRRAIGSDADSAWQDIVAGRTKQETLSIFQGPHAAVWMRRIAKLDAGAGTALGGDGHVEVILARNPATARDMPAIEVLTPEYDDGDRAPTIEFVQSLRSADRVLRSPARDHRLAVSLLSGAYQSMVRGAAVRIELAAQDWAVPPGPLLSRSSGHDAKPDK